MSDQEASDTTEFERFRDLAEKLARVPKKEIDAERDREEAERGEHRD